MSNTIELWEVNKLINRKFYVPTYQRGYTWDVKPEEHEIKYMQDAIKRGTDAVLIYKV